MARDKIESEGRDQLREWLRGKSRAQFADLIGITLHGLERILSGRSRPGIDRARMIEYHTEMSVQAGQWASRDVELRLSA